MEIRGYAPDLLQRMPGQTGGDAVDASWQLVAHGSRQVRPQALHLLALECAASVGVCHNVRCAMRYPRGSIQLNQSRDLPLLRQILRSEFVTHSQLFEFTQLNHYERSRNSFLWRMRRLVDGSCAAADTRGRHGDAVYSVASSAATLLQSMGEYCLVGCGRTDAGKADRNVLHAIGLKRDPAQRVARRVARALDGIDGDPFSE